MPKGWTYDRPTAPGFYWALGARVELCLVHVFYDRPCDPLLCCRFDAITPFARAPAMLLSEWGAGCAWRGPVVPPDPVPVEVFERAEDVRRVAVAGAFRGRPLAIDLAARLWRDASRSLGRSWLPLPDNEAQLRRLVRGYLTNRGHAPIGTVDADAPTAPSP